jgi:hypothetical protein
LATGADSRLTHCQLNCKNFVPELEPILEKLARAQHRLLRAADAIPAELWQTTPEPDTWSAAELVAHLMIVERAVIRTADKVLHKVPKPIPVFKRFHLPLTAVELRLVRLKSPLPLDPALLREKEGMLAELRDVRERTLAFMHETAGRDLSAYRWRHPFLGFLSAYDWFSTIALHEIRHEKQMREIAAGLPKVIAHSQK